VLGVVIGLLEERSDVRLSADRGTGTGIELARGGMVLLSHAAVTRFVPNPGPFHVSGVPESRLRAVSLHLCGRMMGGCSIDDVAAATHTRVNMAHNESQRPSPYHKQLFLLSFLFSRDALGLHHASPLRRFQPSECRDLFGSAANPIAALFGQPGAHLGDTQHFGNFLMMCDRFRHFHGQQDAVLLQGFVTGRARLSHGGRVGQHLRP
jgi:hypothetical protein